jgi:hypothetical protein
MVAQVILEALLQTCGDLLRACLAAQTRLVDGLEHAAHVLKTAATPTQRRDLLAAALTTLSQQLPPVFRLPLDPALEANALVVESCGFFNSKTLPLRLVFKNSSEENFFGRNVHLTDIGLQPVKQTKAQPICGCFSRVATICGRMPLSCS